MATANLTAARLRELLEYNPVTGAFTRLVPTGRWKAKTVAGNKNARGYIAIGVDGRLYKAHRLAWLYIHGRWPAACLDHISGDPADNRLSNLREATQGENLQNQRRALRRGGLLGASWYKAYGKWRAHITINGRQIFLGYHQTEADAHAAYLAAKRLNHPFGML